MCSVVRNSAKIGSKKEDDKKVTVARYQVQIFRFLKLKKGDSPGIRLAITIGNKMMLIQRRSKRKPKNNEGTRSFHYSPSGLKATRVRNR